MRRQLLYNTTFIIGVQTPRTHLIFRTACTRCSLLLLLMFVSKCQLATLATLVGVVFDSCTRFMLKLTFHTKTYATAQNNEYDIQRFRSRLDDASPRTITVRRRCSIIVPEREGRHRARALHAASAFSLLCLLVTPDVTTFLVSYELLRPQPTSAPPPLLVFLLGLLFACSLCPLLQLLALLGLLQRHTKLPVLGGVSNICPPLLPL